MADLLTRRSLTALVPLACLIALLGCTATANVTIHTAQPFATSMLADERQDAKTQWEPVEPQGPKWDALPPPRRIEIRQRGILASSELYAASRGYRFGPGANNDFEFSAGRAAQDIENLPPAARAAKMREAARNLATCHRRGHTQSCTLVRVSEVAGMLRAGEHCRIQTRFESRTNCTPFCHSNA